MAYSTRRPRNWNQFLWRRERRNDTRGLGLVAMQEGRGSDRLIFRSSPQSIPSHSLTHSFTWPPVAGPDDIDERRMKTRSLFSPPTNRASRMVVARLRELAHACWVRFTSTWATPLWSVMFYICIEQPTLATMTAWMKSNRWRTDRDCVRVMHRSWCLIMFHPFRAHWLLDPRWRGMLIWENS